MLKLCKRKFSELLPDQIPTCLPILDHSCFHNVPSH